MKHILIIFVLSACIFGCKSQRAAKHQPFKPHHDQHMHKGRNNHM